MPPIDLATLDTTTASSRASYDSALARLEQDTIRGVDREMRGRDVTQVHAALVARFHARLPGIEFGERHLQKVAAAISEGSLPG